MRKYALIAAFVALVHCRPEPPSYKYPQPLTSYGTPVTDNNIGVNTNVENKPEGQNDDSASNVRPIIHKHVYFHIPPPDEELEHRSQKKIIMPPQKHYKILFIKAPTDDSPSLKNIPLPPQHEEKTIVYVLVKNPEDDFELSVPTNSPVQPSKPEVYYIRYKTKKDGTGHVENGYEPSSTGYNFGNTGYDSGNTGYDSGSTGYDSGSTGYNSGSPGYSTSTAVIERSTVGKIDRHEENISGRIPANIISGGTISDALLGVGTVPDANAETTAVPYETTGVTGPY